MQEATTIRSRPTKRSPGSSVGSTKNARSCSRPPAKRRRVSSPTRVPPPPPTRHDCATRAEQEMERKAADVVEQATAEARRSSSAPRPRRRRSATKPKRSRPRRRSRAEAAAPKPKPEPRRRRIAPVAGTSARCTAARLADLPVDDARSRRPHGDAGRGHGRVGVGGRGAVAGRDHHRVSGAQAAARNGTDDQRHQRNQRHPHQRHRRSGVRPRRPTSRRAGRRQPVADAPSPPPGEIDIEFEMPPKKKRWFRRNK